MVRPEMSDSNEKYNIIEYVSNPEEVISSNIETNTALCAGTEKVKVNDDVPLFNLLVITRFLEKIHVRVPKDDACKTKLISLDFHNEHKKILKWRRFQVEVRHSKSNSSENLPIIAV